MKASKFSDARKAYILKQGADGTLVVIPHGAIGSDCCPPSVQGQAERPDLAGQTWRRTQPGARRLAATIQPRLARLRVQIGSRTRFQGSRRRDTRTVSAAICSYGSTAPVRR